MNLLDVVIILLVLGAVLHGAWRGFWMSLAVYVGSAGGLLLGVLAAPAVIDWFGVDDPGVRQGLGVVIVLLGLALGGLAGGLAGAPIRAALASIPILGAVDSALGAIFLVAIDAGDRLAAGPRLRAGAEPGAGRAGAAIVGGAAARLGGAGAAVLPCEARRARLRAAGPRGVRGARAFAALAPHTGPGEHRRTRCGGGGFAHRPGGGQRLRGRIFGSGFPVAGDLIVTNAHVVAGTHDLKISGAEGTTLDAELVYFDPGLDLAVLRVAGGDFAPLEFADAERGDQGATIGYPGGGNERIAAAVVNERREAIGRDIYNGDTVEREILVLSADVHPGNSGGPIVDRGWPGARRGLRNLQQAP